jgi:hypothetical protein
VVAGGVLGVELGLEGAVDVAHDRDGDAVLVLEAGGEVVELVEPLARVDGDAALLLGGGHEVVPRGVALGAGVEVAVGVVGAVAPPAAGGGHEGQRQGDRHGADAPTEPRSHEFPSDCSPPFGAVGGRDAAVLLRPEIIMRLRVTSDSVNRKM